MSANESLYSVNLDEFGQPAPMQAFFCEKLSKEEYEQQASAETEKAIQGLIDYLESNPKKYKDLLQKRKQEDIENAGILSFLKARLLQSLQGASYKGNAVSEEECQGKLEDLKTGMLMAFNYSQENKGRVRYSRRLAKKRGQQSQENSPKPQKMKANIPPPPPLPPSGQIGVPPPPPCPPPALTILKDKNIFPSPRTTSSKRKPLERTDSMLSIQEELLASNPLNKLRSTRAFRSPGGTPLKKKMPGTPDSLYYDNPLDSSEPLSRAFIRVMEQKFRNVRSPSPAAGLDRTSSPLCQSPSGFTP